MCSVPFPGDKVVGRAAEPCEMALKCPVFVQPHSPNAVKVYCPCWGAGASTLHSNPGTRRNYLACSVAAFLVGDSLQSPKCQCWVSCGTPGLGTASLRLLWALPAPAFVWSGELHWFVGLKIPAGAGILLLHWKSSSSFSPCRNRGFQNGTGIHVASAASCLFKQGKQSNPRIKTSSAFHLLDHAPGVLWEGIKRKEIKYIKKKIQNHIKLSNRLIQIVQIIFQSQHVVCGFFNRN